MKLFYFHMIFPISVACVERLFSKMKLVKPRLRNNLKECTLDQLLMLSTEGPTEFTDSEFDFFVDELKEQNPNMRMDLG